MSCLALVDHGWSLQHTASGARRHHPFGVMHRHRAGWTLPAVTRAYGDFASTAPGHAPPVVVALACGFLVVCALLPLLLVMRCAWSARRSLGGCPVCGGHAVREGDAERLGFVDARVSLQCGQCGVWRRLVVNQADQRAHTRRLARDRRRIRGSLLRLEGRRRELEMRAFILRLRAEIAGAEDFLAITCPPPSAWPARRPHDR